MTIVITAELGNELLGIARQGELHLHEVARVFAYLRDLDELIREKRISLDFWNVSGSAAGTLESRHTLRDGTPIWRLYPQHRHAIALLMEKDGEICLIRVCGKRDLEEAERALSSA
jgi:hypothetical protein